MVKKDLEKELEQVESIIENKIKEKIKNSGLHDEYELAKQKRDFFDKISSILRYGKSPPSILFESRPKLLILTVVVAVISGVVAFLLYQHLILILLFIVSISLIIANIWVAINFSNWTYREWNYRVEAEKELDTSDIDFQKCMADKERLKELLKDDKDHE